MKITVRNTEKKLDYSIDKDGQYKMSMNANGEGISPMEALLGAAAACSSVDTEIILAKMRQKLKNLSVEASGKRAENQVPKVFTDIHLKFILEGDIKQKSAEKAVSMAVEKYCSVASSLNPDVNITYEVHVI